MKCLTRFANAECQNEVKLLENKLNLCQIERGQIAQHVSDLLDKNGVLTDSLGQSREQLTICRREKETCNIELAKHLPPAPPSIQWAISTTLFMDMLRGLVGPTISIDLGDRGFKLTLYSEMQRFLAQAKVYEMTYGEEVIKDEEGNIVEVCPDCDDFTRRGQGLMVCKGWWWQPALDCWFRTNGGGHSEMLTVLADDRDGEIPAGTEISSLVARLFLIEWQAADLIELAEEVLVEFGVTKVYNINP